MPIRETVSDTRISTAELGEFHYRKFLAWAFVNRQSKAAYARNTLVARTDANTAGIQEGLEFYSQRYGISAEELCDLIVELDADSRSIAQIHQALEERFKPPAEPDGQ